MGGLTATEIEFEAGTHAILAAEKWSGQYGKNKETHAKLIKTDARLERVLIKYFKELSERAVSYINWFVYDTRYRQVAAAGEDFAVDVMISDDALGKEDGLFIQAVFDPIAQATALGAEAGEKIYSVNVGASETSTVVQRTAKEQVAELVGKKLTEDGSMIDNPRAKYKISNSTRTAIRESLSTSLSLGEDQNAARERLANILKNPKRAETIARTEAVNAYQRGLLSMGKTSGAVGKEWQSVNNDDICGTNAKAGIIPITEDFPSGHSAPAAHPNCRCGMVLIYPEDPRAAALTSGVDPDLDVDNTDLASIVRAGNTRPASEINNKIEDLLNGSGKDKVTQAIIEAQKLNPDDASAMLSAITYNGKSVTQDFYKVQFNPTTKKIERVLKDPKVDPLKMSPEEILKYGKV